MGLLWKLNEIIHIQYPAQCLLSVKSSRNVKHFSTLQKNGAAWAKCYKQNNFYFPTHFLVSCWVLQTQAFLVFLYFKYKLFQQFFLSKPTCFRPPFGSLKRCWSNTLDAPLVGDVSQVLYYTYKALDTHGLNVNWGCRGSESRVGPMWGMHPKLYHEFQLRKCFLVKWAGRRHWKQTGGQTRKVRQS